MMLFRGIGEDADLCDMVEMFHSRSEEGRTPPKGPPAPIRRLIAQKARLQARYGERKAAPSGPSRQEICRLHDEKLLRAGPGGLQRYEQALAFALRRREQVTAEEVAAARLRGLQILSRELQVGGDLDVDLPGTEMHARHQQIVAEVVQEGAFQTEKAIRESRREQNSEHMRKRELEFEMLKHDRDGCPVARFHEYVEARWQRLSEKRKAEQTREGFEQQFADAVPTCRLCEGGE